jgi:S-formylglutathione hydrolase FrmB
MVIGYHRQRLARLLPRAWQLPLLFVTGLGFAALVVVYINQSLVLDALESAVVGLSIGQAWSVADLQDALLAKGDVRVWRVLASAVVFAFLFQLTTLVWAPIRRGFGWLLLALGQNALYAYSLHVVIAVALAILSTYTSVADNTLSNAAIQLASIGLIWIGIRFRILYPSSENTRYWKMSVVPLIAATIVLFRVDPAPAVATAATVPAETIPLSDAARHARAFGTPVPRILGAEPGTRAPSTPVLAPPPTPAPTPVPSNTAARDEPSGAAYVGQISGTFREVVFYSPSLNRDMSYYIYLPPGYSTEGRRYPVLYMLHGAGGNKDEWAAYGLVDDVDQSIVSKDIKPMIVVMPQGDQGYWVNWADGGPLWGDYVANDLRTQVDATFRTLPNASHRAIGGLSMGGAGALQLAFNHPDVFQNAGAHSPSLHVDDGTFSGLYGTGPEFEKREPIDLAANAPDIDALNIWIDAGEDDPWVDRDTLLHETLLERGIAHNWKVFPGAHDGDFWTRNLPAYLRFYDSVLNGESY